MSQEGSGARVYRAGPATGRPRGLSEWSLTTRVQRYFEANPDEWLTWDDACTKFGCTKETLKGVISELRQTGRIDIRVVSVLAVGAIW